MAKDKFVFISYSSKDENYVKKIVEVLKKSGISYWKAPEMIPAGSNYAREIPRAIQECAVFLLVVSETSQASIWVEKEVDTAVCSRRTIIPIQIDQMPLNDMYRFYLNNVQMIPYNPNYEKTIEEMYSRLQMFVKDNSSRETDEKEPMPSGESEYMKSAVYEPVEGIGGRGGNVLRLNRIPTECEFCGGPVKQISIGIYRCLNCSKDNYDYYQRIRNYLEMVGPKPAVVIARATGVPRSVIEHYFREEYLEIPIGSSIRVPCERCGAPIRTGTLCDNCKNVKQISDKKTFEKWRSRK